MAWDVYKNGSHFQTVDSSSPHGAMFPPASRKQLHRAGNKCYRAGNKLSTRMCCVSSAAFLLADSWKQLLQHIELIHIKHKFITELIGHLNTIWEESFQETPNPSVFPSGPSSPRALLTYTSDVLSKWLALNCHVEICVFLSPTPQQEKEHSGIDREPAEEESIYGTEGERGKRWLTVVANNGDVGSSACPSFFLCILCCLRMLLDVMLKELG
ncbi:uncharacterized protein zgc:174888 isoform X2 [Tachysurus vachellii]|uniref:uncharacterized protein zgc:174888 isoform X2 n=1 Tax=Tachysurus vachellii TaxID=175792 RepID=UPI00296AF23B|nr:uncharacterized protein zgc:174888 isoform X2 [Tachysurus vachellii]